VASGGWGKLASGTHPSVAQAASVDKADEERVLGWLGSGGGSPPLFGSSSFSSSSPSLGWRRRIGEKSQGVLGFCGGREGFL
jgi:hypothetical protein